MSKCDFNKIALQCKTERVQKKYFVTYGLMFGEVLRFSGTLSIFPKTIPLVPLQLRKKYMLKVSN